MRSFLYCIPPIRKFSSSWRHIPNAYEVTQLKSIYNEPQLLVESILKSYSAVNDGKAERVTFQRKLNGKLWRTQITVPWPMEFTVSATSDCPEKSKENAYLLLCSSFQDIGLLGKDGETFDWKDQLLEFQDKCYLRWRAQTPISFHNVRLIKPNGQAIWQSMLNMKWPMRLQAEGQGLKQSHAEQEAAARTIIRLKAMGYINRQNKVLFPKVLLLPNKEELQKKTTIPDFEVFVDASRQGFGAYLFENSKLENDGVVWIQENWPDGLNHLYDSTFIEFYAIVSAVYTWKKKFHGCHVKVWSDNLSAVNFINSGYCFETRQNLKRYFQVLQDVSTYYHIMLEAEHVPRVENQAADHLSKSQIKAFRELVPLATTVRKKCKKLTFINCQTSKLVVDKSDTDINIR